MYSECKVKQSFAAGPKKLIVLISYLSTYHFKIKQLHNIFIMLIINLISIMFKILTNFYVNSYYIFNRFNTHFSLVGPLTVIYILYHRILNKNK